MPSQPNKPEYVQASNAVYYPSPPAGSGLTPLMSSGPNAQPVVYSTSNGTVAAAYKDQAGNVIIAYQGTDPSLLNIAQDAADIKISNNVMPTGTFNDAVTFAKIVEQTANAEGIPDTQIYVTGHSLGGDEAEYVAEQTQLGGATFGATGLPGYNGSSGPNAGLVDFVNGGDPVGNYASDAAESSIISGVQYHDGSVVPIGNGSDNTALVNDAQAVSADISNGQNCSLALYFLATNLSNTLSVLMQRTLIRRCRQVQMPNLPTVAGPYGLSTSGSASAATSFAGTGGTTTSKAGLQALAQNDTLQDIRTAMENPTSAAAAVAPPSAAVVNSIESAAQARIGRLVQAMATFPTQNESLQTGLQTSFAELHDPYLAVHAA